MSQLNPKPQQHNNLNVSVLSGPDIEPITVDEVKVFGRIDTTSEDTLLSNMITSVREAAERYTGRAFIQQQFRAVFDSWLGYKMELPFPPLISVDKIATLDADGNELEVDSDDYYIVTDTMPGMVVLDRSLPVSSRDYAGNIIEYTAGYGEEAADVPNGIKQALLLWTTIMYENRVINPSEPPPEVMPMLFRFKVMRV
jgi:uncharacterized phiE125 gp8 family phage protein